MKIAIKITLAIVLTFVLLYVPFRYSTQNYGRLISDISALLTTDGGIAASDVPYYLDDAGVSIVSSSEFITAYGQETMENVTLLQEKKLLPDSFNANDLWPIYFTYYKNIYNDNMSTYMSLAYWYANLNKEPTEYKSLCNKSDCRFVSELSAVLDISKEEIIVSTAHQKYHEQLEQSIHDLEISDDELNFLYESYILSNLDYIEELTLETTFISEEVANSKFANWTLYGNKFIINSMFGNIKQEVTFTGKELKEIIDIIPLSSDPNIISEDIANYVPSTLISYALTNNGAFTNNTSVVNISGVEDVNKWLEEHDPKEVTIQLVDISNNERYIDCGIGKLYWVIKDVKHKNIPGKSEIITEKWLYDVKKTLVEETIWEMIYEQEDNTAGKEINNESPSEE